jgi:hypothetical protein
MLSHKYNWCRWWSVCAPVDLLYVYTCQWWSVCAPVDLCVCVYVDGNLFAFLCIYVCVYIKYLCMCIHQVFMYVYTSTRCWCIHKYTRIRIHTRVYTNAHSIKYMYVYILHADKYRQMAIHIHVLWYILTHIPDRWHTCICMTHMHMYVTHAYVFHTCIWWHTCICTLWMFYISDTCLFVYIYMLAFTYIFIYTYTCKCIHMHYFWVCKISA